MLSMLMDLCETHMVLAIRDLAVHILGDRNFVVKVTFLLRHGLGKEIGSKWLLKEAEETGKYNESLD